MIKLFVTDIDGCLAEPYEPYDLEALSTLRRLADGAQGPAPALSICSGRPYPISSVSFGLQVVRAATGSNRPPPASKSTGVVRSRACVMAST